MFTALAAVATIVLHLMGEELHRAYLQYWHLDVGLFPKTTDWLLIYGYHASAALLVETLALVLKYWWWLPAVVLSLAVYLWLLFLPLRLPGFLDRRLARLTARATRALAWVTISAASIIGLIATIYLVLAVAIAPALLARHVGEKMAAKEYADFQLGCEQSKATCVQLRKEGRILAQGHVLESSATHIALYEASTKRSVALPRDGTETAPMRGPRSSEPPSKR